MGFNSCAVCGRSYPMPDLFWDSWDGLDYMDGRRSVTDEEFYAEYQKLEEVRDSLMQKYGIEVDNESAK